MNCCNDSDEVIEDVPEELVQKFESAFPADTELIDYVRKGDCERVNAMLFIASHGLMTDIQQEASRGWTDLYDDQFGPGPHFGDSR